MQLNDLKENMQKTIEATQRSFNTLRTGRASAALLDRITVEYYGTETPLKSLANITTPDASTILIQPFDKSSVNDVARAISMSDLGLTPNTDGALVRLNIPPLTTERRKELVKTASKLAEEGKVSLRNIRREAIEGVRKQEKASDISEDESRDLQDKVQKVTDEYTKKVDELFKVKEQEIMKV